KKTFYVARLQPDGCLNVHVHHQNQQVREQLRWVGHNPSSLLAHEDAYSLSTIRAQYWLAQVMAHHRRYFGRNRVRFVFE
ncbi:MAG: hypothetical protein AAB289_04640, partial [Chloroflexota bacterium]